MKTKRRDLYGSCPDESPVALILIDVINDFEFEEGERMLASALPAAEAIVRLKRRAREIGIPVIYANDNFGRWRSDFNQTVQHCLNDRVRGAKICRLLEPEEQDYFILKPKHSAFFATSLQILLDYLGARTLILAGFNSDICVMFTAKDAYMADYRLVIPRDCVASVDPQENDNALRYIERVLKARICDSENVKLEELLGKG